MQALDAPQNNYGNYARYYRGEQPLAFHSEESTEAIGDKLSHLVVNVPRVLVNSLAERMRVSGMSCDKGDVWSEFVRNDLDQLAGVVHRSALLYGQSFVLVWGDGSRPVVTVESPQQVQVLTDPATRAITSAVKRWENKTKQETHAMLYLPDQVQHWRGKTVGAANTSLELIETLPNPMGQVPIVRFLNADLICDEGTSEIADIMGLTDALSKLSTDMLTASEFLAKPRRYLTGEPLEREPVFDENGDPVIGSDGEQETKPVVAIPDGDRFMQAEGEHARFGQLDGAPLDGFKNSADLTLSLISAVSNLPPSYLGIVHSNPSSAEAIKSAEAGLISRATSKMASFGRSWEAVGRLMASVITGADPHTVECRVKWSDPNLRSEAQLADAAMKWRSETLMSRKSALRARGLSDDEITEELKEIYTEMQMEALAKSDPALMRFAKSQEAAGNMSYAPLGEELQGLELEAA
ncbi:phage portal protein [Mycolicibacterium austroafricanum]|uniref:phage portal protein n=1 Tax=Mycolicibacterium austroafricanum TaxID=39687 RepID=UPI001CA3262B|nr:phage portal protein [Mycolicibacterium austroafricanum]QZT59269.1 phage portal protein [Mycolicibacterium austroafricanum]